MIFKKIAQVLVSTYYKIFFKLIIKGEENLKLDTGFILCPNHFSNHDPFVIGSFGPISQNFMAKAEIFKNPVISFVVKSLDGFPVERDGNDLGALKKSIKLLKNKKSLLLFAEGHRNKIDKTKPLEVKSGVAMIAFKSKVPIIPVTIESTYKLFSEINIIYHQPVDLSEYYGEKLSAEKYQEISDKVISIAYGGLKK